MKLALIDIGSNTIRLLICDVSDDSSLKRLKTRRIVTRLADNIIKTQRLNKKGRDATLKGLLSFLQTCKTFNISHIYAIATSAIRDSIDGKDFINEIESKTGINVEVISGEQEAGLTYEGLKAFVTDNQSTAIIDIGGGSTEFIYIEGDSIIKESLPFGVVRLKDMFLKSLPADIDSIRLTEEYIINLIKDKKINRYKPQSLFITGGTATTLACIDKQLKRYNPELIHLHFIDLEKLTHLIEKISKMDIKDVSKIVGIDTKRADVILPGVLVIKIFLLVLNLNNFIVSDYGLLEGLAINKAKLLSQKR